tara:strand:+ start:37382 stop:37603 length:222 start_codon:yes stop_codon:yes gene_type:complete
MRMLNAGKDLASILQNLEVSESTYLRWRNQYGGMKSEEAKRLKQHEESLLRMVTAVLVELSYDWETGMKYLTI